MTPHIPTPKGPWNLPNRFRYTRWTQSEPQNLLNSGHACPMVSALAQLGSSSSASWSHVLIGLTISQRAVTEPSKSIQKVSAEVAELADAPG